MHLHKVISGGQTGVDIAALEAAREVGVATGGWMPLGFRTQNGPRPEYEKKFGMREIDTADYARRTRLNVKDSHATLRIAQDFDSPGERRTLSHVRRYNRPLVDVYCDVDGGSFWMSNGQEPVAARDVARMIYQIQVGELYPILNVAGNSERNAPGIGVLVRPFLVEVFRHLLAPF